METFLQIFFSEGPETMDSRHTLLFQLSQCALCDQRLNKVWTKLQGIEGASFTTNLSTTNLAQIFSFVYYLFVYLFVDYLLCVLAVVFISRDGLSEATHAKDSGDLSVRVWQGESRCSISGDRSQFQTGTHSFHCLT